MGISIRLSLGAALLCSLVLSDAQAQAAQADPPPVTQPTTAPATMPSGAVSPEALLDEAIELMTQSQYRTLILRFATPEDLAEMQRQSSIDEVVQGFEGRRAEELLTALREAKELDSVVGEDDKRVTYHVKNDRPLVLVERDGRWYIGN